MAAAPTDAKKCYDAGIERHKARACAGEANRQIYLDDPESWKHFCTPGCQVKLVTPRLVLRPVELSDNDRIFRIKSDRLVNQTQIEGQMSGAQAEGGGRKEGRKRERRGRTSKEVEEEKRRGRRAAERPTDANDVFVGFTSAYITDSVPFLNSLSSARNGRYRHVLAIQPRKDQEGKLLVEPKHYDGVKRDLDGEGYIGNLAIEYTLNESSKAYFGMLPQTAMEPVPGEVFTYPSQDGPAGAHAVLFYELHPNFWSQGLITEAIKEASAFAFRTLKLSKLVSDPLSHNPASIRLCEKLGLRKVGTRSSRFSAATHVVVEVTREEWEKERGKKAKKNKAKKKKAGGGAAEEGAETAGSVEEGDAADPPEMPVEEKEEEEKPCCLWCQFPSNPVTLSCSGCSFGSWCSQPCKTADLTYAYGYALACPGKGGKADLHAFPARKVAMKQRVSSACRPGW
ncbi:hypothetical protein JCM8547_004163 [Rhodosporidiobolus lusitaniae]